MRFLQLKLQATNREILLNPSSIEYIEQDSETGGSIIWRRESKGQPLHVENSFLTMIWAVGPED